MAALEMVKNTSRYPTDEVRQLIDFAVGDVCLAGVAIHVKNCRYAYAGRAYNGVPTISAAAKSGDVEKLVTIRLGAPDKFPVDNMCTTWKYYPWQAPDALPPAGFAPGRWGQRLRRVRGGYQVRYLEPRRHPYGGQRSPLIRMADWREALVAVAAHEARHLWQYAQQARRSEVDAERYAALRLELYRLGPGGAC
jgi:hypothetical protein